MKTADFSGYQEGKGRDFEHIQPWQRLTSGHRDNPQARAATEVWKAQSQMCNIIYETNTLEVQVAAAWFMRELSRLAISIEDGSFFWGKCIQCDRVAASISIEGYCPHCQSIANGGGQLCSSCKEGIAAYHGLCENCWDKEYQSDYQEREDLYRTGMGG